jgi:hypothetical protein
MDKGLLELLHEKLTAKLLERLGEGDITASEMSVIRQFLNDNNVSIIDDNMGKIKNTVPSLPNFNDLKLQ